MQYPECKHNVPMCVKTLIVVLATGKCYFESDTHCKSSKNGPSIALLEKEYPNGIVKLDVAESSRPEPLVLNQSLIDTGDGDYYCNVTLGNVTLGASTWLIGTKDCVISRLSTTGRNVHVENVTILEYGPLNAVGLELIGVQSDAFAVVAPTNSTFEVACEGLLVVNASVAVGACRDQWTISGPFGVAIYQSASKPTVLDGASVISVDTYIGVFGRDYEQRFLEGATDTSDQQQLLGITATIAAASLGVLLLSCIVMPDVDRVYHPPEQKLYDAANQ